MTRLNTTVRAVIIRGRCDQRWKVNPYQRYYQEITGDQNVITTSRFPGTTLDKIEIPLDDGSYIYDTPGIIHRHQMAHYLTAKTSSMSALKREIKPKTYQLNPEQTLFLGGLG